MKTKVIYFILTAILIISVLSAIAIYATVADTKTEEVPTDVKIEKIVSRDIEKTKSVKLGNGETIELNYNKTRNLSLNQFTDDYTDKNNNTFEFNEKGKLSGFVVNDVVCSQAKTDEALFAVGNGNVVSESDVINVAKEHLSKMFGERFSDFQFDEIIDHGGYMRYTVVFTEKFGENGFVNGNICYCDVFSNGTVFSSDMVERSNFEDFNEARIKGITEDDLLKYATEAFNEVYGERLKSIEVTEIKLIKNEDKYSLEIIVGLEIAFETSVPDLGMEMPCYSMGDVIYYALD